MNELALFAGAGGGILGGVLLGWRTVCAVEIDAYAASVLLARQNDGVLPPFPIWDDIRTFDGRPWRGLVDVVSGGFPCQDISVAGKGAGITGERSGLWKEMCRVIGEVRPQYAFVENVPALISRGLDVVLGDLAEIGYDAEWTVLGADDIGAPHRRKRVWILAYSNGNRLQGEYPISSQSTNIQKEWSDIKRICCEIQRGKRNSIPKSWICRKGERPAGFVDRIKAIGNGQVPLVAATAWRILIARIGETHDRT